ncbi:ACP S-malonyltransferase [Aeoliella mucimassa]|uniref:ACP S-malonyltransferase n=1 Tax=Aeoliella mucimassa TaxID=2527972 RepID=UPI00119CEF3F|nr:ACP S-malonyltransferase [Aeoliella mucimassa]
MGLPEYPEAVAFIMSVELAQLEMLETVHDIRFHDAKLAFGYSLGELTAVAAKRLVGAVDAMTIPVALAWDCASLASDIEMGILFSRSEMIPEDAVHRLCERVTAEMRGVVGTSSILSPNTLLVLGQHGALGRFKQLMHEALPKSVLLKRDPNIWPPLHTPIVRQRWIPDRASVMMERMLPATTSEGPQLFSLATGAPSYQTMPTREVLRRWVDHPQRLWDAVTFTLREDVDLVVHVGPGPNVIPATFQRLSDNVSTQLARLSLGKAGVRAVSNLVHRRWLANLLPDRAALLRAPGVEHVILEDWLLENAPR